MFPRNIKRFLNVSSIIILLAIISIIFSYVARFKDDGKFLKLTFSEHFNNGMILFLLAIAYNTIPQTIHHIA